MGPGTSRQSPLVTHSFHRHLLCCQTANPTSPPRLFHLANGGHEDEGLLSRPLSGTGYSPATSSGGQSQGLQRSPSGFTDPSKSHIHACKEEQGSTHRGGQARDYSSHLQTPCPRPPISQGSGGSSNYLFIWSWMNFPKRLLLLFLSVHAFPTDHTSVYTAPLCLQSPQGPCGCRSAGAMFL